MTKDERIAKKLEQLPRTPGVYEMLDDRGKIIYVGKAINLKNRVRSYFKGNRDSKTRALVEHIDDFRFTLTKNEVEALVLESNLIKENRPKYNVVLRDDKHYPYIRINKRHAFPRIEIVRRRKNDGSIYFGPYTSVQILRETLHMVEAAFSLRTCSDQEMKNRSRPCLNYQIKRCSAPCVGKISEREYGEIVDEIIYFLQGKEKKLLRSLEKKMNQAAVDMEFEKAADYRDQIQKIKRIMEQQRVDLKDMEAKDIIGFYPGEREISFCVLFLREGKVLGKEILYLEQTRGQEEAYVMEAFLEQYYGEREVPKEVLVPLLPQEKESIESFLTFKRGNKVTVTAPSRGTKKGLLEMAKENAREAYEQKIALKRKEKERPLKGLLELQEKLALKEPPKRIECYDISNISGTNQVASMVVFTNGLPDPASYRKFKIRTVIGPNDFLSMEEVLTRRFKNLKEEKEGFDLRPDLLIIDGGKGQLSSARKILKELGLSDIPTFGLAKKEELLFKEGHPDPIVLERGGEGLFLVQRIRDEAHRFAITFHRSLRGKEMTQSVLDEVKGIGPKKKKALLQAFGSIKGIRKAGLEEIEKIVGKETGERVKDILGDE